MAKTAMDLVQASKAVIQEVSVSQAEQMLADDAIALDVRDKPEFETGHIDGAENISRGTLEFMIGNHPEFEDKTRSIVVVCKSGGRAAMATATLQQLGYSNVVSMIGGYDAWCANQ